MGQLGVEVDASGGGSEHSIGGSSSSSASTTDRAPGRWTKLERIRYLLDHWSDIYDPNIASSLSGQRGGSGLDPRMTFMAQDPSVVTLWKALKILKRFNPRWHDHLMAYRCNVEWRQRRTKIKFRGPNGRMVEGDGWEKQRIVPRWVDMAAVSDAENWLNQAIVGDIWIPKDLWNGLTKPVT